MHVYILTHIQSHIGSDKYIVNMTYAYHNSTAIQRDLVRQRDVVPCTVGLARGDHAFAVGLPAHTWEVPAEEMANNPSW